MQHRRQEEEALTGVPTRDDARPSRAPVPFEPPLPLSWPPARRVVNRGPVGLFCERRCKRRARSAAARVEALAGGGNATQERGRERHELAARLYGRGRAAD